MSVFFAHRIYGGDRLGILNPSYRDKLLTAVHELKLYGGPLPDSVHLVENSNNLSKKRLLPVLSGGSPRIQNKNGSVKEGPGTTPHKMVRKTESDLRALVSSQPEEKGQVKVCASFLHPDSEYKTIDVTASTTSKELAAKVLVDCKTASKDPNLYYIAMETQLEKKDSSLPISKMVLLDEDSQPLELQMCQPQGQTKFHLKMKNGGLVRVRANILSPGVEYTSVHVARNTTAHALIKMVLVNYGKGESPDNFLLRESSANLEVDRILKDTECPLQVQSKWKPEDQRSFHLTRRPRETQEKKPAIDNSLSKELEKRNTTILVLQESIRRLIRVKEKERVKVLKSNGYPEFGHAQWSHDERHELETAVPRAEVEATMELGGKEGEKQVKHAESIRQRRTSIESLHLETRKTFSLPPGSQIDKFRDRFWEYQRSTELQNRYQEEALKQRRTSAEIAGQLRHKFREYCEVHRPTKPDEADRESGKLRSSSEGSTNLSDVSLTEGPLSRSSSLDSTDKEVRTLLDNSRSCCDAKAARNGQKNAAKTRELQKEAKENALTLHTLLENRALIKATMTRRAEESWGIELAHVTETGISGKRAKQPRQESRVVYVRHHGEGRNAVLSDTEAGLSQENAFRPITTSVTNTPSSGSLSGSTDSLDNKSKTLVMSSCSSAEELPLTPKKNSKPMPNVLHPSNHTLLAQNSPFSSRPGSALTGRPAVTFSLPQRPSSALAHWKKDGSPETRPGVWIAGITPEGVATKEGHVHVDDLIIEINGQLMLNASLDKVIKVLHEADTINLVVARALEPELYELPSHGFELQEKDNDGESFNGTDIGNLTEQVQSLAGKISELQEEMTQKDKTISSYKKALAKMKRQKREHITETMKIDV